MNNSKGQNVVEYILLVVAVLIVCIYFFSNQATSPMGKSVNGALNSVVNMIDNLNKEIQF